MAEAAGVSGLAWGILGALVLAIVTLIFFVLALSWENDKLHRRLSAANRQLPQKDRS